MKKEKRKRNIAGNEKVPDRVDNDKVKNHTVILESQHDEINNFEEYEHVKNKKNKKKTSESVHYHQENNTSIQYFSVESKCKKKERKKQRTSDNEQNQERVNNDQPDTHRKILECQHNRINYLDEGELSNKKKKKKKTSEDTNSGQENNIDITCFEFLIGSNKQKKEVKKKVKISENGQDQERVFIDNVEPHTCILEDEHKNQLKKKKKKKPSENVIYDQEKNIDNTCFAYSVDKNKHRKKEKRKTSEQDQQTVEVKTKNYATILECQHIKINNVEGNEQVKKQKKNKKLSEGTHFNHENNIDDTHLEYFVEGNEQVNKKKKKRKTSENDQDQERGNNDINEGLRSILEGVYNKHNNVEEDEHLKKQKKNKKTSDGTHSEQENYNIDETWFEYSIGEDKPIKKDKKKRKTSDKYQAQENEIYGSNSEHFIEDIQFKKSKRRKITSEQHIGDTNIIDNIDYDQAKIINEEISGTSSEIKKIKKKKKKRTSACIVSEDTSISDNFVPDIKDHNKNRYNRKEVISESLPMEQTLFTPGSTDLDKIFGSTDSSQRANNLADKINKLLKRNDISAKNKFIDENSNNNINNHYSKHISLLSNDNSKYEDTTSQDDSLTKMTECDELTSCKKKTKDNSVEDFTEINSIHEVEDKLHNHERENEKEKVQSLEIESPWTLPLIHTIANRVSTQPTPEQRRALEASGIQLKLGKYTKEEDEKIMKNWRIFCKLHQWEENYYQPFVNGSMRSRRGSLTRTQFRKFVQFISHGFEDRLMYNIYLRFQRLFSPESGKNRKFTPEDDKLILKYVESAKSDSPFADLAMTLKRSRLAIYKHYQLLNSESSSVEIKWDKELTEILLDNILTVTQSSDVPDLKDRQISKPEWQKISENMSIPIEKLKRAWLHDFYPRFVFPVYTEHFAEAKEKIVNIVYNKYKDWREIDWYDVEKEIKNGMNHSKLSKLLKDMVGRRVPENKKHNFRESLEHLKQELSIIKSRTCNTRSYVEDILRERELTKMVKKRAENIQAKNSS